MSTQPDQSPRDLVKPASRCVRRPDGWRVGLNVVWHAPEPRLPLVGLPAGVLAARLRLREGRAGLVFLRFADRIECRVLLEDATAWGPGPLYGCNATAALTEATA